MRFTPTNGQKHSHLTILETLGAGVALADFDRDGDLDLLAAGGGTFDLPVRPVGRNAALFRNEGGLKFTAISDVARLPDVPFYSHATIVADYDNDGFSDVLITGYGGLLLLRNNGDGTFQNVTEAAGLSNRQWNATAGWGDLNGDGNLDLYVVRYVDWSFANNPRCGGFAKRDVCPPERFRGLTDSLYFSSGDGSFRDASRESGIIAGGNGLGVILCDLDGDGDVDIFVANDASSNFLYLNDGRGNLSERGVASGVAFNKEGKTNGSMGVDVGDFNRDGRPDLWVTNFEKQLHALYRNEGNGRFEHVSSQVGIERLGRNSVGFGTVAFDADFDGDEDIFVANGHVRRFPASGYVRQMPFLLENRGRAGFIDVAAISKGYLDRPHLGRGVAAGDLDGDGDVDLVVSHTNESISVLSNECTGPGRHLGVRLVGTKSPRDAIGATITIRTESGRQTRWIKGGGSYLSTSSLTAVFGLGGDDRIMELQVHWPSGAVVRQTDLGTNREMTIIEPETATSVSQ